MWRLALKEGQTWFQRISGHFLALSLISLKPYCTRRSLTCAGAGRGAEGEAMGDV